jgi:hypothetical protein
MKVMKRFQTEEEFEAWKNSPQYMTPYTVAITSTGAVHMYDGDDDDYSITAVIKMTGWITIATRGMMKYIDKIYKNGEEKKVYEYDEELGEFVYENSPDFTYAGRQTYYYRKKLGTTQYYKLDDYIIPYALYAHHGCTNEVLVDSGVAFEGSGFNYRKRFAKTRWASDIDFNTYGDRYGAYRRFLYVEKGDIVKIVFKRENLMYKPHLSHLYILGEGKYYDEVPKIGFFNKYASEVKIGDGFKSVDANVIKLQRCKKIFLGKNIEKFYFSEYSATGGYYKKRIFARENVSFINNPTSSKIIRIK